MSDLGDMVAVYSARQICRLVLLVFIVGALLGAACALLGVSLG